MNKEEIKQYFLIGITILLIFICYKLTAPYIISLITAFILAYLVKPIHERIARITKKEIAAVISVLIILLLIITPAVFIFQKSGQIFSGIIEGNYIEKATESLTKINLFSKIETKLNKILESIMVNIGEKIGSTIYSIPSILMQITIIILGMYYFLVDWENLKKHLIKYIPFIEKKEFIEELKSKTNEIVYGLLLIATIQGIIAYIGLALLGVPNSLFFSTIIFLTGIIPLIGAGLVWIPLFIYYLAISNYYIASGILILGLFLSYVIDTLAYTKITGKKSKIHPMIVLIGLIGGLSLFGFFGFLVGPLLLVYTIKLIEGILEN